MSYTKAMDLQASWADPEALWAWLAAHSVGTLSTIYLASLFCLALLAIRVYSLSRRHAAFVQAYNAKLSTIEQLVRSSDDRLQSIAVLIERAAAESRAAVNRRAREAAAGDKNLAGPDAAVIQLREPPSTWQTPAIRGELEQLMAEFGTEGPGGTPAPESLASAGALQANDAFGVPEPPHPAPGDLSDTE